MDDLERIAMEAYFNDHGSNLPYQQPSSDLTEVSGNIVALHNVNGLLAEYEVNGNIAVEIERE
jgi:hypothetical protein